MITSLGYRLEDTGHTNFVSAQKLVALNDAQRQIISMCTNEALVHLQVSRTMGTVGSDTDLGLLKYFVLPSSTGLLTGTTCASSNGRFTKTDHGLVTGDTVTLKDFLQVSDEAVYTAINDLTSQVTVINSSTFTVDGVASAAITTDLDSGTVEKKEKAITRIVSAYDDTNDRFVELTTIEAIGENTSYNYGTKGALFNNKLYFSSSDTVSDITLIYITSPSDIVASDVEITDFSDSVQQAIIEGAESLLWRQDNRLNRSRAAGESAMSLVQVINAQGV